ncbi:MAG: endo-1,4-beta-xylanase [Planctomycetota bacterium]
MFESDGPIDQAALARAHMFGPQGVPVQADIRFESGLLVCEKAADGAGGLCLPFNLDALGEKVGGGLGTLMCATCLLPDRHAPYLLTLELARRRIMSFLNKLEDWGLFDAAGSVDGVTKALETFEKARATFTRSLVAQSKGDGLNPEASSLGATSLALAIEAGEQLSLSAARRDLPKRILGRMHAEAADHFKAIHGKPPPPETPIIYPGAPGVVLPGRPLLGVTVDPARFDSTQQKVIKETCDFVSIPMRWTDMEPTEGRYNFKPTDKCIEWAVRKARMPIVGGPVIDLRPGGSPKWLHVWENDYETLRELVYEHVKQVVTRYRRTIRRWTVATSLHVNSNFQLTFEQMMDLTRVSVLILRKLHPQAKVQLEITQPWGEYYAEHRKSLPPQVYADMVQQVGIAADAIGLGIRFGSSDPGQAARDLLGFAGMLDRFGQLERPIAVTCLGVPSEPGATQTPSPGSWRGGWTDVSQGHWLARAASIALSRPFVHSVCWQGLVDPPESGTKPGGDMAAGGLLRSSGEAKPALDAFRAVRMAVRRESGAPLEKLLG